MFPAAAHCAPQIQPTIMNGAVGGLQQKESAKIPHTPLVQAELVFYPSSTLLPAEDHLGFSTLSEPSSCHYNERTGHVWKVCETEAR